MPWFDGQENMQVLCSVFKRSQGLFVLDVNALKEIWTRPKYIARLWIFRKIATWSYMNIHNTNNLFSYFVQPV
jgi:hypothetical protein